MKLHRWNDWVFIAALVCFVAAPLGSFALLRCVELPLQRELHASYDPNTSRPGHFMESTVAGMIRMALTASAVIAGLILAAVGGIRLPKSATSTRKLRSVTWMTFGISVLACLVIPLVSR